MVNFIQYAKDAAIEITYSATINEDALVDTGNINTAKLTYSNNPNNSGKGENGEPEPTNPTGQGPDKTTITRTTGIELLKVDKDNTDKKLSGAAFTITGDSVNVVITTQGMYVLDPNGDHWMLNDGTYTTDDPNTEGMDQDAYASTTDKYSLITVVDKTYNGSETVTAADVTNANGQLKFEGLGQGLYTITETKAPTGYNLLANPIYVYIKYVPNAAGDDGAFHVYRYKDSATAPTVTDETDFTTTDWTELTPDVAGGLSTLLYDMQVENGSGTELPSTGGIGTTIFYVVGSVLVLGAAVILISRKRMAHEQ
jgi:LPXTG-motif cell wall-anchored protein